MPLGASLIYWQLLGSGAVPEPPGHIQASPPLLVSEGHTVSSG